MRVVRPSWPECKSFSGAAGKYAAEAVRAYEQQQRQGERTEEMKARREQERAKALAAGGPAAAVGRRWQAWRQRNGPRSSSRCWPLARNSRTGRRYLKLLCLDFLDESSGEDVSAGYRAETVRSSIKGRGVIHFRDKMPPRGLLRDAIGVSDVESGPSRGCARV